MTEVCVCQLKPQRTFKKTPLGGVLLQVENLEQNITDANHYFTVLQFQSTILFSWQCNSNVTAFCCLNHFTKNGVYDLRNSQLQRLK